MKASKKIRLLQGITAVRVRLGLTQAQLAQQIGVSRSAISMLESGQRTIPTAALIRLSKLEISLMNTGFSDEDLVREITEKEKTLEKRQMLRIATWRLQMGEFRYKLNQMKTRFRELSEVSHNLRFLLQNSTDEAQTARLRMAWDRVEAKIKRCDRQARAKLEGRIAGLEIMIAASEEVNIKKDARITPLKTDEAVADPNTTTATVSPAIPVMLTNLPIEQVATDEAEIIPKAIPANERPAIPTGYAINRALLKEDPKQVFENTLWVKMLPEKTGHDPAIAGDPISSSTSALPLPLFYKPGSCLNGHLVNNPHSSKTRLLSHPR